MMPSRSSKKDSPAKLAGRMKRRWRVVLLRNKGEILGEVEGADVASAKAAAADQFDLDEIQRTLGDGLESRSRHSQGRPMVLALPARTATVSRIRTIDQRSR